MVLREKQEDIDRVRHEIWALRVAIPLIEEPSPGPTEPCFFSAKAVGDRPASSRNDLELYYPFLKRP